MIILFSGKSLKYLLIYFMIKIEITESIKDFIH